MSRTILLLATSAVLLLSCLPVSAVTINWTPVGSPGNAADTATGSLHGLVPYNYNIGTYDVTNSQYAEFLNSVDPNGFGRLQLYSTNMRVSYGGIDFILGNPNGSKFVPIAGRENTPVNCVTWFDAIRFANWLNNGQGSGDTETGSYTLGTLNAYGLPFNSFNITRNVGAKVFLPNENEWYKAAYFNPSTNSYFHYPTSSNTTPIASYPTALANHANFYPGGPFSVTNVGTYTGTTSPYGAFDMGGNVSQWIEALEDNFYRGYRGGSFDSPSGVLLSSTDNYIWPQSDNLYDLGFRVASLVPEPSSVVLAGLGFGGFAAWAWRRRKRLGPS